MLILVLDADCGLKTIELAIHHSEHHGNWRHARVGHSVAAFFHLVGQSCPTILGRADDSDTTPDVVDPTHRVTGMCGKPSGPKNSLCRMSLPPRDLFRPFELAVWNGHVEDTSLTHAA